MAAATSSVRSLNVLPTEKKNITIVSMAGISYQYPLKNIAAVSNYSKQRRSFRVRSSASVPKRSVRTINGNKVNGISVGESPLLNDEISGGVVDDLHQCLLGKFVEKRFVYRQTFIIRSYETGPDGTATMETLMNLLQVRLLGFHPTSSCIYIFIEIARKFNMY